MPGRSSVGLDRSADRFGSVGGRPGHASGPGIRSGPSVRSGPGIRSGRTRRSVEGDGQVARSEAPHRGGNRSQPWRGPTQHRTGPDSVGQRRMERPGQGSHRSQQPEAMRLDRHVSLRHKRLARHSPPDDEPMLEPRGPAPRATQAASSNSAIRQTSTSALACRAAVSGWWSASSGPPVDSSRTALSSRSPARGGEGSCCPGSSGGCSAWRTSGWCRSARRSSSGRPGCSR